jgi:hypothetical protein
MSVECKTAFPGYDEGIQILFPPIVYPIDLTVKEVAGQAIKRLIEENESLRSEIKALRGIIKNMSG